LIASLPKVTALFAASGKITANPGKPLRPKYLNPA
jgi:hypothetical protein